MNSLHPWRAKLNTLLPASPSPASMKRFASTISTAEADEPLVTAFARPDETLANAVNRYYPRRRNYGWRYQNGVKPGEAKLQQFREVLRLRGTPPLYSQDGLGDATLAYVKLFDPCGNWTWYLTEWDGTDEAFGLVDGHEQALGYISLPELAFVPGRFGIGIEIDMHWLPTTLRDIRASDH